jgi:hypothetical protein
MFRIFKYVLCFFSVFYCVTVLGQNQIPSTTLDEYSLPKEVQYTGKIINAVRWSDKLGDNIVVTTETGEITNKASLSEDTRDAAIYGYHYILSKNNAVLNWRVYDFVKDCAFDIEANFIKNTLQITDLNRDGVAEIWLMYKIACFSDVSPHDMKIIMYQNKNKFAIRGQNKVILSEDQQYGGDYTADKAFTNGPKVFLDFAKKMWNKNILQTWE